jgi:SOS-response transcriptional repressor LexA
MTPEIDFQTDTESGSDFNLTDKQERILRFVVNFQGKHNYSPSYREIVDGAQISSISVVGDNLRRLAKKEFLTQGSKIARTIVLTDKGREALSLAQVLQDNEAAENPIESASEN